MALYRVTKTFVKVITVGGMSSLFGGINHEVVYVKGQLLDLSKTDLMDFNSDEEWNHLEPFYMEDK